MCDVYVWMCVMCGSPMGRWGRPTTSSTIEDEAKPYYRNYVQARSKVTFKLHPMYDWLRSCPLSESEPILKPLDEPLPSRQRRGSAAKET